MLRHWRWYAPIVAAAVLGVTSMLVSAGAQQQPTVIKLATGAETHLSAGKGYGKFAELVNERAKGRVKVEVYYAGALGAENAAVRNMLAGTVEMSTISDANLGAFTDALFFMNLPYMFEGTQALRKVMDDPSIREEINRNLAKVNMRGLLFLDNGGPRNVQTNKGPVRVPADLKGQKIRTTSSPVEIAIFKTWGALTTPIAWPEVYTALSQGTVDGEGIQYTWMYSTRHYEVLKYVCENAYVIGTQNGLIRLDVWNRLPKDLQDLILAAASDAEAWEAKIDADFTNEAREKIIAAGVKVYRPTADELQLWKQAVAPRTWETFKDKVAPDFIKRIQALQKKA